MIDRRSYLHGLSPLPHGFRDGPDGAAPEWAGVEERTVLDSGFAVRVRDRGAAVAGAAAEPLSSLAEVSVGGIAKAETLVSEATGALVEAVPSGIAALLCTTIG